MKNVGQEIIAYVGTPSGSTTFIDVVYPSTNRLPGYKYIAIYSRSCGEDGRELRRLCEHRDALKRELAEVKQQRDDLIHDISVVSCSRNILVNALRDIAEGCSFPTDEVMKAVRDRCRLALAEATVA